jgi:DNA polymerase-3 subunit delta'
MSRAPETLPEPDRAEGAPHPRFCARVFGQAAAEREVLAAHAAGRLHHGWLLCGPRGIGKASFAWRMARFLLTEEPAGGLFAPPPPVSLDAPEGHPVLRRMQALAEPRLLLVRRGANDKGNALSQVIAVDVVREVQRFLHMSVADGGRRVVIVDAADELNPAAANALLKLLEEPPAETFFLLVAHQPARLLPTIRSRCRALPLAPLSAPDLSAALAGIGVEVADPQAMAELAGGSAGLAVRLAAEEGLALYAELLGLVARPDRGRMLVLADSFGPRAGEGRFDMVTLLADRLLSRMARRGATGEASPEAAPGEAAVLARLAPDPRAGRAWADLAQGLTERARRGRALNLDAGALCLDMLLKIEETAAATSAATGVGPR